ncbi:hypothetical protein [Nocardioides sp. AE5]|uniref:hypothetical protein n=1 Tax=Nocardioides sp. AE5 TaxID=2962573 RepID=UPI002880FE53|nr:hypothetical protein [Nocardioides sp. AE5]MDT0201861.1 hypothetical protein [Nocardioides sp. AE5]
MSQDSREPVARDQVAGRDQISHAEIRKDALQDSVEAGVNAVGQVGGIITGAVRDVARTLGGLATELFEIRDAARRAQDENRD